MTPPACHLRRRALATVPVLALALSAACSDQRVSLDDPDLDVPTPTAPEALDLPPDPVVLLRAADDGAAPAVQQGSAAVEVGVVTLDGGAVGTAAGRGGQLAIRFPEFSADEADYPRAVLTVTNSGTADQMAPGDRDFAWGADLRLDRRSAGGAVDNGDNLLQRGTSGFPRFFKAEVDRDRAACTVRGDEGTLVVRASETLRPGWWYRMRCERTGRELAVHVTEFAPDGTVRNYASRIQGPIGTVAYADPSTPLTVGGKIGEDGQIIRSATDQFNGLVMNPVLAFLNGRS